MTASRCQVLLLEDDPDDAWLTEQMLRETPGGLYDVDRAVSIEGARDFVRRKSYDALLVDHYLPDGSGLEFIQECTSAGLGLPMILLTGRGDVLVDRDALKAGASDYLTKGNLNGTLLDRALRYSMNQTRSMTLLQESEQILTNALNSLSCQLAILNENGTIVAVNKQWRDFSLECKMTPESGGVGMSYLELCRDPARGGEEVARTVAQAIEDVRDAQWTVFSLDFACTTPRGALWFNLRLSAYADKGAKRITIEHHDITERRNELDAAIRKENQMRVLAECLDEIVLLVDRSRSVVYVNSAIERVTGIPAASAIGRPVIDLICEADRERMIERRNEPNTPRVEYLSIRRADGSPVPAEVTITDRLSDPDLQAKVVIFRPLGRAGMPGRLPSSL